MPFRSLLSFHRRLASVTVAAAYLFIVRSMSITRTLLIPLIPVVASCASPGPSDPVIHNDFAGSRIVLAQDIQVAIALAQQRCVAEGRGLLSVYAVDVAPSHRIYVHCGPHYGAGDAPGALVFTVERSRGTWRITGMQRIFAKGENIIVT
jgi:hypothetical protein